MNKLQSAKNIISQSLKLSKRPVVCCSFGKDSMTLLSMVQDQSPDVDVLFFPEIEMHHKNLHAYQAAVDMQVGNLYSYPATYLDYIQRDDYFEVLKYHYVDGKDWYVLYNGCRQYIENEKFLCVEKELLPSVNLVDRYSFPWDCIFHGQKEQDAVHFVNKYEFIAPITRFGKGVLAVPLFDWTDKEAFSYAILRGLPVQQERYVNNESGLSTGNKKQDYISSDVIPCCFKCLDYRNVGKSVLCPRTNETIPFCGRTKIVHDKILADMFKASKYKEV